MTGQGVHQLMPPPKTAEFPERVLFVMCTAPFKRLSPPPDPDLELMPAIAVFRTMRLLEMVE